MSIPTVAIITRTMDRTQLLRRTLQSVLAQSYKNWVWVLVNSGDPGPVDALLEEFSEELDGRFTLINLEEQPLMGAASNAGVVGSVSKYVVLLDDDDTWDETFLDRTVATLESKPHENMAGVVTRTVLINEHEEGGEWVEVGRKLLQEDLRSVNLFQLASVNQFPPNAFVYERRAYEAVGGYREDLPVLDDWDFNLRFMLKFDVHVIPEGLARYHIRPKVTTGAGANSQVAGESLHIYYHAAIVNHFLRKDIEDGKAGLGQLLATAHGHFIEVEKLDRLRRKLQQMSTKVGRIDARTKELKSRIRK
jgi:glycosyltransferase involved in cell wall biosynthesis